MALITATGKQGVNDSAGAWFINQLEKFDPVIHQPLSAVTWGRDIKLRTDVSFADESTSYANATYTASGSHGDVDFSGANDTSLQGVDVDMEKTTTPLMLWVRQIGYSNVEEVCASRLNLVTERLNAMNLKYQMDVDRIVYVGSYRHKMHGLINSPKVTNLSPVSTGAGGGTTAKSKTVDEILADVNEVLSSVWQMSGLAFPPSKLLMSAELFGYLTSRRLDGPSNMSIINFIRENSLCLSVLGKELDIQPVKWLSGVGAAGTNRMVAYTDDADRVRYPLVPLQRVAPPEYRGIHTLQAYQSMMGGVEFLYPETIGYRDGL